MSVILLSRFDVKWSKPSFDAGPAPEHEIDIVLTVNDGWILGQSDGEKQASGVDEMNMASVFDRDPCHITFPELVRRWSREVLGSTLSTVDWFISLRCGRPADCLCEAHQPLRCPMDQFRVGRKGNGLFLSSLSIRTSTP